MGRRCGEEVWGGVGRCGEEVWGGPRAIGVAEN